MARERTYDRIPPSAFTADGEENGLVTIADTACYKVKMTVTLTADVLGIKNFVVNRVLSSTQMLLGPDNGPITGRANLLAYTMAANTTIEASEQKRPDYSDIDYERYAFEEEPTLAKRVFNVDKYGKSYTVGNPFPVRLSDGSVHIGTVNAELEVQLSHQDNVPDAGDIADSVQIGDGVEIIQVNPDGSINIKIIPGLSGTPIKYLEHKTFNNTTETVVATFTATSANSRIIRMLGEAPTLGVWKIYRGTVNIANLVATKRTSFSERTADLKLEQQEELVNIGDKLLITFQAERYRTFLLGAVAATFVRLEGSY